jgi:hypothetical protein
MLLLRPSPSRRLIIAGRLRLSALAACSAVVAFAYCSSDHVVAPPRPAHISIVQGDGQTAAAGYALPVPLVALVTDVDNHPLSNVPVTWTVTDGGTVTAAAAKTDATGEAMARWTLGADDQHQGSAAVGSLPDAVSATFSAREYQEFPLQLDGIHTLDPDTYDGSRQTVHPDIARTPHGWSKLRQHLALTPYPAGNALVENPSIFASKDGVHWSVQPGVSNPIVRPTAGILSDPDLVYVPETNELWMYYRQAATQNTILLTRSSDGIHWGPSVVVARAPNHEIISPAVVHRASGEWLMWSINGGPLGCTDPEARVELRRSADGVAWSPPEPVALTQGTLFPWHIDVEWIPSRHEFWALYNVKEAGSCTTAALYLATSPDGVSWTTYPSPVLTRGMLPQFQDIVYRSTFEYVDRSDEIRFWYSGATYDGTNYVWHSAIQRRTRSAVFDQITRPGVAASAAPLRRQPPPLVNPP